MWLKLEMFIVHLQVSNMLLNHCSGRAGWVYIHFWISLILCFNNPSHTKSFAKLICTNIKTFKTEKLSVYVAKILCFCERKKSAESLKNNKMEITNDRHLLENIPFDICKTLVSIQTKHYKSTERANSEL